ncbi:MAG: GGDEF domain-containing protein, partial [Anaerolineae bacterium]
VNAALKVTRFKLESFSVPVKVQENLIARAFVSGELQAATGNPEAMAVGTEPSISGKMASAIERISGAKGTACVPLRVGEKSVGVLIIVSPREQLADDERAMLLGLADQAGLAIQNARLYEETQQLAITDGLTGLYNLRYFYEALEKEIQRSERYHRSVSLIILDIDNFKRYNDTYGHLAGDDLLKELAQLMSKVTRQTDTLARYGGEEFAIILPETETEGAEFLAQRLQEEVREHRFSTQDDQTIGRITISLGVATYPHHAHSTKALVDAADMALLRAKQAGKNRLFAYGKETIELKPR